MPMCSFLCMSRTPISSTSKTSYSHAKYQGHTPYIGNEQHHNSSYTNVILNHKRAKCPNNPPSAYQRLPSSSDHHRIMPVTPPSHAQTRIHRKTHAPYPPPPSQALRHRLQTPHRCRDPTLQHHDKTPICHGKTQEMR
jgi:hypothetical protein